VMNTVMMKKTMYQKCISALKAKFKLDTL
jgi:hypothetical protein